MRGNMKIQSKLLQGLVLFVVVLFSVWFLPIHASAEVQEANFIEHDGGDLAFSFFYEADVPDLVFISPSGVEYAEGVTPETELVIGRGEGWSNYRIPNAEAGQWRLRYDKKNNATIDYVEVKPIEAIAIQSFVLTGIEGETANVSFRALKGDEKTRYYYTISLVDGVGSVIKENLASGWADAGEEKLVSVRLNVSTRSDYKLMLNVSHSGEQETFDSATTEAFSFTNPNTPAAIADFAVQIDSERSRCTVDWKDNRPGGRGYTYSVFAIADGDRENPIYNSDVLDETNVSFFYPVDATKLEIEISYFKDGGVASEVKTKTIELTAGEYLRISSGDVVGEALLPLEYSVNGPTELKVSVNGVDGAYLVDGEGVLRLSLQSGTNTIEASFVGSDNLVYSIAKEVFYTWVSPTILLHEDLDGMTFKVGMVPISGQVEEAASVTVNGTAVELAEDGNFSCEVPIVAGENTITIEAVSAAGVSAVQTLTIVGDTGGSTGAAGDGGDSDSEGQASDAQASDAQTSGKQSFVQVLSSKWMPTVLVAVVCLFLLIFFFVLIKDKKKKKTVTVRVRGLLIFFGLLEAVLGFAYYRLYSFNNSLEYMELAQNSVKDAAAYLNYETYGKYALIGIAGVIVILILILLIICAIKKLKAKKVNKAAEADN